jgi:hypothetical protein
MMTKTPNAFPLLALPNGPEPIFLPTSKPNQRFHNRWWTALPAIPTMRECIGYRRLWRQFGDHTMNTFSDSNGVFIPRGRGFYVEGREDHLVPAFFENFSLFPDFSWLECLLARLGIPCEGKTENASWSYSFEQVLAGESRPRIADIVVMWRDNRGKAVLVIEAKKPGCGRGGIGMKDDPTTGYYLKYREMRSIDRTFQALLVDEDDVRYLSDEIKGSSALITWQEVSAIQRSAAAALEIPNDIRELLLSRLDGHYSALSLTPPQTYQPIASGNSARYAELRGLNAPDDLRYWLVGSELFFAARNEDGIIDPPYDWLCEEPTVLDYAHKKLQSTHHRERPIWLI